MWDGICLVTQSPEEPLSMVLEEELDINLFMRISVENFVLTPFFGSARRRELILRNNYSDFKKMWFDRTKQTEITSVLCCLARVHLFMCVLIISSQIDWPGGQPSSRNDGTLSPRI